MCVILAPFESGEKLQRTYGTGNTPYHRNALTAPVTPRTTATHARQWQRYVATQRTYGIDTPRITATPILMMSKSTNSPMSRYVTHMALLQLYRFILYPIYYGRNIAVKPASIRTLPNRGSSLNYYRMPIARAGYNKMTGFACLEKIHNCNRRLPTTIILTI